jgi:hypothetical protein
MQFPNKLYSYKNSTLALLPEVLNRLKKEPVAVKDLFWELNPILEDPTDFLSALDCLYAMQLIEMTEDMEAIFLC